MISASFLIVRKDKALLLIFDLRNIYLRTAEFVQSQYLQYF